MRNYSKQQVEKVLSRYTPEHDMGADCPVTWREEAIATAVLELEAEICNIREQVRALLDAVPSAKVEE